MNVVLQRHRGVIVWSVHRGIGTSAYTGLGHGLEASSSQRLWDREWELEAICGLDPILRSPDGDDHTDRGWMDG